MAAITVLTPSPGGPHGGLYETIAIVNQTAASTAVSKAIAVPEWARYCTFVVEMTTVAGTSPTFDFTVRGYDGAANSFGAPDDGFLYLLGAGWDGITQQTGAKTATIHIGPDIATDDTGSATASDAYGVGAPLPIGFLVYTYTTTDATDADDTDYSGTITAYFRKH